MRDDVMRTERRPAPMGAAWLAAPGSPAASYAPAYVCVWNSVATSYLGAFLFSAPTELQNTESPRYYEVLCPYHSSGRLHQGPLMQ